MVFHITTSVAQIRRNIFFKFIENTVIRFAQCIHQNIQASTMRHADNDFFNALHRAFVDDGINPCNRRFTAFKRKTFFADEFFTQKIFKTNGFVELLEDAAFLIFGQSIPLSMYVVFDAFAQPKALFLAVNMAVFKTDMTCINAFQTVNNLLQSGIFQAQSPPCGKNFGHIFVGQTVFFWQQMGLAVAARFDGICR